VDPWSFRLVPERFVSRPVSACLQRCHFLPRSAASAASMSTRACPNDGAGRWVPHIADAASAKTGPDNVITTNELSDRNIGTRKAHALPITTTHADDNDHWFTYRLIRSPFLRPESRHPTAQRSDRRKWSRTTVTS
jgi:hypothetical protein